MKVHARRRTGATRVRTRSANISGSTFGHHASILQGDLNIFKAFSPSDKPSAAVQARSEEEEKMDCRRSLSFRDIDARLQNISPVQPGTCEWVFEMPLFRRWYDRIERDNGLLWIKGNPGTGKSTLMRHILEHCQTKEDYVVVSYFFNTRGAELEQTLLGMLRSLLFQLLEHEPWLYDQLLPIYRKKQQDYRSDDWEWREPELKSFLMSEIPKCQSRPLLIIIDALDECNEHDMQSVAKFLQDLSSNTMDDGYTLNICLSSRHYPFIRFKEHQELVLEKEKQHDEDIVKYIASHLTKRDEEIEKELREKSSGIFMWVVLVITMLNSTYEDGKVEAMKRMLEEIPARLEEMFAMMLEKNNPDKDETILILQCVLFAKRRLRPEELYFAIVASTNSKALGRWDPLKITPDIIRRRIISSSRGLIEICKDQNELNQIIHTSRSDFRKAVHRPKNRNQGLAEMHEGERETVQFIHGSVNDFLLRNSRLQRLDPGLIPDPVAKSHDRLRGCCMAYLMMESLELQSIEGIESSFPFLEYASRYLFGHAEEATSVGQAELLWTLKDNDVFRRVERFHNYFVDYGQKGKALNLLQVLAALGLPKMVAALLDEGADINAKGEPRGTALQAAIEFQSEETVKTLLSKGAQIGPGTLRSAFRYCNREILAMLIEKGAKLGVSKKVFHGDMLRHAVISGDKDIVEMVLDKRAKFSHRGLRSSALCTAAERGHKDIAEMLLEKGAKVNAQGFRGSALCVAASGGNKDIMEMLLEKGAKINARGLLGTALAFAAATGEMENVEMLLEKGAKINTRGLYGSPLTFAALRGRKEVVKMLLKKGAKVEIGGLLGNPLQLAAMSGHKEIVELLLNKGAKVNAWGGLYGNAVQRAAMNGHKEVVEMLLAKGANINARGSTYSANKASGPAKFDRAMSESRWMVFRSVISATIWRRSFGAHSLKSKSGRYVR